MRDGAPEGAGLREMRVDDLRTPAADHAVDRASCADVVRRIHPALEVAGVRGGKVVARLERSLVDARRAPHEARVETPVPKLVGEEERLARRAADVQPRDDAEHTRVFVPGLRAGRHGLRIGFRRPCL